MDPLRKLLKGNLGIWILLYLCICTFNQKAFFSLGLVSCCCFLLFNMEQKAEGKLW